MDYALHAICRFARVLHVRDFFLAYACLPSACLFKADKALLSAFGRVQGPATLLPSRHEAARAASASGGSAVGGSSPYKCGYRESVANGAGPLNACALAHGSCACNAQASAHNARYRSKKEYVSTYGHRSNLIITVPIDTNAGCIGVGKVFER